LPGIADGLGLMMSEGLAGVVTGFALKVALVLEGTPLTLRFTELETPPAAPRMTV
jgi:hypothetical protein